MITKQGYDSSSAIGQVEGNYSLVNNSPYRVGDVLAFRRGKLLPKEDTITKNGKLMLFLGYLVANACIPNKGVILFASYSKPIIEDYKWVVKDLYNKEAKTTSDGSSHNIYSVDVVSQVLGIFNGFNKARSKTVPSIVRNSSVSDQRLFLRSLFDCDGHLQEKRRSFEFSSASEEVAEFVQNTLLSMGIISIRKPKKVKGYEDHMYWRVFINGEDCNKMLGTVLQDSLKYPRALEDKPVNSNKDFLIGLNSIVVDKIDFSRKLLGVNVAGYYIKDGMRYKYSIPKFLADLRIKQLSYPKLMELVDWCCGIEDTPQKPYFKDIEVLLLEALDNNYFYDTVTEVEHRL